MVRKNTIVVGYISGDCLYRHNLDHFNDKHQGQVFLPSRISGDQKVDIVPGTAEQYTKFVNNLNGDLKSMVSGGGGKNSQEAFKTLGVPCYYVDTCTRPDFATNLTQENSYFGGVAYPGLSLVIPTTEAGGAGTFILKSGRGDINQELRPEFESEVTRLLNQGGDVLVSSISSEPLANLIANNKSRGDLYTVITTYLPKEGEGLNDLLRNARANIFSFKEFYWALDDDVKYQHLASEPFNEDKAKEIAHDMHLFAHDRKIVGSLMVTLGQHGAIHYYRNNGKSKSWIHLKEEVKSNIQDFLKERNQDTKSAGDKFTAGAINALQKSKSLEEAVMIGSKFAIENVLKYPNISEQDFEIDFFSQKNRRHYHSDGRPRKTNRIPLSSKEEVVTSM